MGKFLKIVLAVLIALAFIALTLVVLLRPSPFFSSLPSLTKAAFDHNGDPVNIAFVGGRDSINRVFLAAKWLVPDPLDSSSTAKIAQKSISNSSYPKAPVSNLYLFGRAQDLTFELPTNTVRERHHVRLWQTAKGVSGKPLWIGSSSYDSGIELSHVDTLPTHHISPNVDSERDFLTRSLENTGLVKNTFVERITYPTLWGFNGSGDWYFNDGLVNILTLKQ